MKIPPKKKELIEEGDKRVLAVEELYKDGFLTGDADEFRGFMKQRTGLQITMF